MSEKNEEVTPVRVSGEAIREYTKRARAWSGVPNMVVEFTDPVISDYASYDPNGQRIRANVDRLLLNPNRVLRTVTAFRLRQEAVLTGALLHEAAHARYTKWTPRSAAEREAIRTLDGEPVSDLTLALARVMEEARIEGMMAGDSDAIHQGYAWTMRASAAAILPPTELSEDPNQRLLDLLTSYILRAGRVISRNYFGTEVSPLPNWVIEFWSLVKHELTNHLAPRMDDPEVQNAISNVDQLIRDGIWWFEDDTRPGVGPLESAKHILEILFPDGPGDAQIQNEGCGQGSAESGDGDSGNSDDGFEEDENGEETDDQDDAEGEVDDEAEDDGDGQGDTEDETSEDDADQDGDSDADQDGDSDGDESEGDGQGASPSTDTESATAKALAAIEGQCSTEEAKDAALMSGGLAGGEGAASDLDPGWRYPTAEEREIQRGAERFLRSLIDPSETSKTVLTETPSSQVDGAALAAWRASGQMRDPMFFRRTRREVQPSPPVKIAILVDVSGSMEELQAPSALLSWALAAAALDLRNFAGRGQQVESTLIHWGSWSRVIQGNGAPLPGLREVECVEGTHDLPRALELVEEQIPGFFSAQDKPENRLLVQFTDWGLTGGSGKDAAVRIREGLNNGVNMLSVVPSNQRWMGDLDSIVKPVMFAPGKSFVMNYDERNPGGIWDAAAEVLNVK